jgi:hypothetical protein
VADRWATMVPRLTYQRQCRDGLVGHVSLRGLAGYLTCPIHEAERIFHFLTYLAYNAEMKIIPGKILMDLRKL